MTAREFERLFDPSIRCLFNFDRAKRERWPIDLVVVTDRDELGALLLPWRHSARSINTQLLVGQGGVPHTVKTASRALAFLSKRKRDAVAAAAAEITVAHPRAQILPAVRTPAGVHLLDGCHRAVATHLVDADFAYAIVAVKVPRNTDWSFVDA